MRALLARGTILAEAIVDRGWTGPLRFLDQTLGTLLQNILGSSRSSPRCGAAQGTAREYSACLSGRSQELVRRP